MSPPHLRTVWLISLLCPGAGAACCDTSLRSTAPSSVLTFYNNWAKASTGLAKKVRGGGGRGTGWGWGRGEERGCGGGVGDVSRRWCCARVCVDVRGLAGMLTREMLQPRTTREVPPPSFVLLCGIGCCCLLTFCTSALSSFLSFLYGRYSVLHSGTWFSAMRLPNPTIAAAGS
jgi:hypothetical protein